MKNTPQQKEKSQNHQKHPIRKNHNKSKDSSKESPLIKGILSVNSKATGFISNEKFKEDIEIPTAFLNTALHRDEVEIRVFSKKDSAARLTRDKGRIAGEVVKILKRAKSEFVGTVEKDKFGISFLIPDDKKMYADILLPASQNPKMPESGEKVLVKIIRWDDPKKSPEGVILKTLGRKGEHNVEMQSIILEKGFDIDFPSQVEKEAEEVKIKETAVTPEEIASRKDMRDTLTFTIDPADAKDFDDAISFKELPNGLFEIGVHIADVSHYVREGTALDKEARNRGFSVYLVDRTIPMLPEVLSNNLCSLNPNEEKLTFSAVFIMDRNRKIKEKWFGKTIIKSDKRFSYEEAQESIKNPAGPYHKELTTLNEIAKKFQQEKFKNGAIDFEQEEVKFKLDPNGKPIGVYKKTRVDSHKLVEEFMLLANREVAEYFYKKSKDSRRSFIYRIHDTPDPDRLENLTIFLHAMGYELKPSSTKGITSKDIQMVLRKIEGKAEESLIKTAAVRSMAKAAYSTKNIGHFGLAFEYYTHFTSPIRRYADLIVHRLLDKLLRNKKIDQDEFAKYEKIAAETSTKEIAAAEAERDSIKYKQVEFMREKIGQEFDGIISGVTDWGIYVEEIDTKCEGMVKLRDLADDYYVLDEKKYSIVGQKTKRKFTLGDKVRFRITGADLERKTLDYLLI